jgi:hypothetical protein
LIQHLKKSLVALKRTSQGKDYDHFIHIEGIIAYTKSLVIASHREGILGKDSMDDELLYLENLNRSVQVKVHDFSNNVLRAQNRSAFFNSVILLFLALLAPFSLVYREEITHRVSSLSGTDADAPYLVDLLARLLQGQLGNDRAARGGSDCCSALAIQAIQKTG